MNDKGLSVLEQYNLKVQNTYRGRGSLICETDQGLKLIKEFNGSKLRLAFQNRVLHEVKQSGYEWVDMVLENAQGALVSNDKDEVSYIVKDWFEGRECDTKCESDILGAVKNLARLHQVMMLDTKGADGSFFSSDLVTDYEKHNRELKKVRNFIRDKRKKNEFELCFMKDFYRFFEQGEEIIRKLRESDYYILQQECVDKGSVSHGDYNQHNVLNIKSGMAVTNFERCSYNIPISDLYQFMRKILEKHNWNEKIGHSMIEAYNKITPIDTKELSYLYCRLAYPEKFWKIGNHYFNTNKAWIPGKNVDKIQNLVRQEEARISFINNII